jgi:hypothetical protein
MIMRTIHGQTFLWLHQTHIMALSNPYYGWVRDVEAAQAVVTEYSFATSTSYAIPRCTKKF